MRKAVKVLGILAVIFCISVGFAPTFQPLKDAVAEAAVTYWQCSKCGQQITKGGYEPPRQGLCNEGGHHVWQRLR